MKLDRLTSEEKVTLLEGLRDFYIGKLIEEMPGMTRAEARVEMERQISQMRSEDARQEHCDQVASELLESVNV